LCGHTLLLFLFFFLFGGTKEKIKKNKNMKGERKERDQLIILFEKKNAESLFLFSQTTFLSFFLSFFV